MAAGYALPVWTIGGVGRWLTRHARLTAPLAIGLICGSIMTLGVIATRDALGDWAGALPLYAAMVLAPAIAGGWLVALFLGSFAREEKAVRAMQALRVAQPGETQLLLRLAEAERTASAALRAKSEFIAHMSHELRTPLNAVIGFSEIIAQGVYGPAGHAKYAEYAGDIADAGRNLHDKIGDILEYANIEAGRCPLHPAPLDLAELAATCVAEHQGRAFSRRIRLEMGFGEPGMVEADAHAVRRILTNLLTNALTYVEADGQVRVEVHAEDAIAVLRVTDTGSGFSAPERLRAGGAFQRFDRPGTVTGAGLGLAIALELARRMGGTLKMSSGLSSELGSGTVMEVRLPKKWAVPGRS